MCAYADWHLVPNILNRQFCFVVSAPLHLVQRMFADILHSACSRTFCSARDCTFNLASRCCKLTSIPQLSISQTRIEMDGEHTTAVARPPRSV